MRDRETTIGGGRLADVHLRDLELRHLTALRAVAAERSFARAGERLGFTQSAISQQIAALERVVGEPVFDRPGGPRPVELTPAGQVLLPARRGRVRAASPGRRGVVAGCVGRRGRLVVGTFQSVSVKVLPPVVGALRAERPQLDIRLFESDELAQLTDRLADGELDLAFVVGRTFDERFTVTHLCDDPFVAICARADSDGAPALATRTLADSPLIGQHDSTCQAVIDGGLRDAGVEPAYVFRSNDNGAVQAMVHVGIGHAVLPLLAVDATDPEVVVQELDPPIPPRSIAIVRMTGRTLPPAAERFVEIAVDVCAELSERARPVLAGR